MTFVTTKNMKELDKHRQKIDDIDNQILKLLNQRAEQVISIGNLKKRIGSPLWVPAREEAIYQRLENLSTGCFPVHSIRSVFREIISASRSLEEIQEVGYIGYEGSFINLVCVKHFGVSTKLISVQCILDLFDGINEGYFNYGIVSIEKLGYGTINQNLDALVSSNLYITGECYTTISYNLLSKTGNIQDIKAIYCHSNIINKYKSWLLKNTFGISVYEIETSSKAAQKAASDNTIAIIGSQVEEIAYNLKIIEHSIDDPINSLMRFFIIGKNETPITGNDKTSIIFNLQYEVEILLYILEAFQQNGISIIQIKFESSNKKLCEYLFYIDVEGHKNSKKLKDVLEEISKMVSMEVLGSYPRGER